MSTFFLHAFLPFLLDWLCCAGAPTMEAAETFFFGLTAEAEACLLFDFVGAMMLVRAVTDLTHARGPPNITAI
jgi:hypothetical protein